MFPLYARCYAMKKWPGYFFDYDCEKVRESVGYDFSRLSAKNGTLMMENAALAAACRQLAFAAEIRDYLREKPYAKVVLLGCGLDTAGHQADNLKCTFVNIDLPDVIELRERLMPPGTRERNIACDIKEKTWFDGIGYTEKEGAIFIASGMFLYWSRSEVRNLIGRMAKLFKGARIAFDAQNKRGAAAVQKSLANAGSAAKVRFYLNDPEREIRGWNIGCKKISCKRMISDYRKLDKRFSFAARLITAYSEKSRSAQINILDF